MLTVTTPAVPDKQVTRTIGLVSGDAILGANILDYETITSQGGSMLMVSVSGTAVVCE